MILTICIPSLDKRAGQLTRLLKILQPQLTGEVEVIVSLDNGEKSIGQKRNEMLQAAKGDYICSIDDDDRVSPIYIESILDAVKSNPDCCSLVGVYKHNGSFSKIFKHSIQYNGWFEKNNILYRYPNHLNTIKTIIAKQIKYPEVSHGEDKSFSEALQASGLIKTESKIDNILYYYDFKSKK